MAHAHAPGVDPADLDLVLARTPAAVWDALRGQRLFITGGTGFIGTWLLEGLLWAEQAHGLGLRLTVLSRDPAAFERRAPHLAAHPAVAMVRGDVRDLSAFDTPCDAVLHLATDVVKPSADPRAVFDDIVQGATQALDLARRGGATRFLLTSSGAVYGVQPPSITHVPESYPGAPDTGAANSAYGQGKRVAEWLTACARARDGLQTQVARCFAFAGPWLPLDAQFAIGNFIGDCLHGRTIRIGGDGTPYRSYLYAADLVAWLLTILVLGDGQAYNVGSPEALSIRELAERVAARLQGPGVTVAQAPVPGRAPARYVPDTARVQALGLDAWTTLDDAIARSAAWHRSHLENS